MKKSCYLALRYHFLNVGAFGNTFLSMTLGECWRIRVAGTAPCHGVQGNSVFCGKSGKLVSVMFWGVCREGYKIHYHDIPQDVYLTLQTVLQISYCLVPQFKAISTGNIDFHIDWLKHNIWFIQTIELYLQRTIIRGVWTPNVLNGTSNETLSSRDTRNILGFGIKDSYFENYKFTGVSSSQCVGKLMLSTMVVAPQHHLAISSQLPSNCHLADAHRALYNKACIWLTVNEWSHDIWLSERASERHSTKIGRAVGAVCDLATSGFAGSIQKIFRWICNCHLLLWSSKVSMFVLGWTRPDHCSSSEREFLGDEGWAVLANFQPVFHSKHNAYESGHSLPTQERACFSVLNHYKYI